MIILVKYEIEDGRFWARAEPIPMKAAGKTKQEAYEELRKTIDAFIAVCKHLGSPLPKWYCENMEFWSGVDE